jgi:hypothetical protein
MADLREVEGLNLHLRGAVMNIRESLRPDEDWAPVAFVVEEDLKVEIYAAAAWSGDAERDAYIATLAEETLKSKAVAVGLVNTVWYRTVDEQEDGKPRPRDDPNRLEAVQVATLSAHKTLLAHAGITRHDKEPPTLGEWTVGSLEEGGTLAPILEALRKVRDA